LGIHSNAQTFLKDTFSFHDTDFDVRIEATLPQTKSKQSTVVLAFITNPDDKATINFEKDCDNMPAPEKANLNRIKVSVSLNKDSLSAPFFERVSSKIISLIVLQYSTHNLKVNEKDIILCGANDGAVLALYMAALLPDSFNKTGIFIQDYSRFFLMKEQLAATASKIRGKVFINTQHELKENFAVEFADSLALNPGIMIYKIDDLKEGYATNIFTEFYKWSVADGNNYIIDTKQ
jgi:hypothetical protein